MAQKTSTTQRYAVIAMAARSVMRAHCSCGWRSDRLRFKENVAEDDAADHVVALK